MLVKEKRLVKLVSSNESKLKEFMRLGLSEIQIEKGKDLKEVDADPQTVILYKAIAAGTSCMVEDTSLHIEGEEVGANIRWLLDNLSAFNGKKAVWEVLLGYNNGNEVEMYQGIINGIITDKFASNPQGFGFDCYFIPDGSVKTLFELEELGEKDTFSARKKAITQFSTHNILTKKEINAVPAWEGAYQ